jgi:outer membrane protein assembly factor BamB
MIAGCGTSDDPFACRDARQIVAPSSTGEPGTVLAGSLLTYGSAAAIAALPDGGVVCLTCLGVVALDAGLRETALVKPQPDPLGGVAVAPDGAIYVPVHGQLVALSPGGEQRWMVEVPLGTAGPLVARTEGAYIETMRIGSTGQPEHVILGYEAATGAQRVVATGQHLFGAGPGGIVTVEDQGSTSVVLHSLDPAGRVVWSHTLTASDRGLELQGVAASPDGSTIVLGRSPAALDLGDRTLPAPNGSISFVAAFDAIGATLGAFTVNGFGASYLAVTTKAEIVVAGYTEHSVGVGTADTHLAVATPAGITRTLDIDGPGSQTVKALATAPDGAVWIQIDVPGSEDGHPDPVMQIRGRTFSDIGTYLFKLAI